MKPLTHAPKDIVFDTLVVKENGDTKMRHECKFPLEWQGNRFEKGTNHYIFKDEDLNDGNRAAYGFFVKYVQIFIQVRCTTLNRKPIFEEEGQPNYVARLINTKMILNCSSDGEALSLLVI